MFKFFLYISLCLCLIYVSWVDVRDPALEVLGEGEYCIYSCEEVESPLIMKCLDSGLGYIYFCESRDAAAVRSLFGKIDGESISVANLSANKVFKILNQKKVSVTENNYYGFSRRAKTFIKNGTQKITLQVSVCDGITTVGWPVILGSY